MASLIQRMLGALFPRSELRGLMVGLDASGRTTALYKMKLGEVVTTIPTIGFNVETVMYEGTEMTMWDVGGCDKIRPLWRHYFQNTQFLLFFVDSNDKQRMPEAGEELQRMAAEPDLVGAPIVILANKQDLPGVLSASEVAQVMGMERITTSPCTCMPCCAVQGEGLFEALHWALEAHKARLPPGGSGLKAPPPVEAKPLNPKEKELEDLLLSWLEREDEPDDDFISKLRDYTLDTWDHRTHLRIAWLFLTREGRRNGMQLIFRDIRNFIENSARTRRSRGSTFHETMTYFWTHMVHYAMTTTQNPDGKFKTFLLLNPQLVNGGMFLHFYSKKLMLNTAEARTSVVLPDVRPLPSLISDVASLKSRSTPAKLSTTRVAPQPTSVDKPAEDDDDAFLKKFKGDQLDRWSHACLLRAIFVYVSRYGRKRGSDALLRELRRIEKDGFHFTIAWFWIQVVDMAITEEGITHTPLPPSTTLPISNQPLSAQASTKGEASTTQPAPVADQASVDDVTKQSSASSSPPSNDTSSTRISSSGGSVFETVPFAAFEHSNGPGGQRMREALSDSKLYLQYYSPDLVFSDKAATEFVLPDKKPLPSLVQGARQKSAEGILGSFFQKLNV